MTSDEIGDKLVKDEIELVTCACLASTCPKSYEVRLLATFPVLGPTYFYIRSKIFQCSVVIDLSLYF